MSMAAATGYSRLDSILALGTFLLVLACGDNSSAPVETKADSQSAIEFAIPPDGAVLSASTTMSAEGTNIQTVSFFADGEVEHQDSSEPFEWVFDPEQFRPGLHLIRIEVKLSDGQVDSVEVRVRIDRPEPEPTPIPSSGSWTRHVISFTNTSYSGNPFELEIDTTFTHRGSGTVIELPGYYAGNDTWKVAFMPTLKGLWDWETSSPDGDLDGKTGIYDHDKGGTPGILKAHPEHARKWHLTGGAYVLPIALRVEFFSEPASRTVFTEAADYMQEHELLMMETRLTEEYGQYENGRHDFIFEGDWRNHEFDLAIWDRFEERLAILAERGLGAHIMLYSDDAGTPGWSGQSSTEMLVLRYLVARTAAYPIIVYNTGIDIAEYRSGSNINWIGDRIRELDPYDHPVSSRQGGGSGDLEMSDQTFDSRGDQHAEIDAFLDHFENAEVPVSMDDAFFENGPVAYRWKDHEAEDIRRAAWKALAAGGLGILMRGVGDGGHPYFYHLSHLNSDLESEQWLKHVNPFIRNELGDTFGEMVPASSLATGGHAMSDPDRNVLVVLLIGENDKYDATSGGGVTVDLSGLSGSWHADWFDPRSGTKTSLDALDGGSSHTLTPPSKDDWVLLLRTELLARALQDPWAGSAARRY
jgi:hypothetical protein